MRNKMNREMQITVNGIDATVVYKQVKNVRVTVLPPFGAVHVSAPFRCPEALIRAFLAEKADWILKHQTAIRAKHANEPTQYESGEKVSLFGSAYTLIVLEHAQKSGVTLDGDRLILSIRGKADAEKREAILNDRYRETLKTEIAHLLPLWSGKTGLVPSGYSVRNMTSRWGSCNTQTGHITLNLQLVKYPLPCLEYVILHELAHLLVRGHGADFKAILDAHMPNWKDRKKLLNE